MLSLLLVSGLYDLKAARNLGLVDNYNDFDLLYDNILSKRYLLTSSLLSINSIIIN